MPDAYEVHDSRLIQDLSSVSAANATSIAIGPVPDGKVWTILAALISTSVAETQYFWFAVLPRANTVWYPINTPTSFALAPAVGQYWPCLREGMEIKLFPGEYIAAKRAAATAGSTMSIYVRIIETDLPLYEYVEPQITRSITRRLSSVVRRGGGSGMPGAPMTSPPPSGPGGGGGRER